MGRKLRNCRKCGNIIPVSALIDGNVVNLRQRGYCLSCSPYKSMAGRTLAKKRIGTKPAKCPICGGSVRKHSTNLLCHICRNWWQKFRVKLLAVKYLGGRCYKCGTDDILVLEFHHTDPSAKEYNVSNKLHTSFETIKPELDKCCLLCSNCHKKHHKPHRPDILQFFDKEIATYLNKHAAILQNDWCI